MNKKLSVLIISSMMVMMIFSLMSNVVATESEINQNGDPYRVLDTNLQYSFPNGSSFIYKLYEEETFVVMQDGVLVFDVSANDTDYLMNRASFEYISNTTTNLTIKNYDNITNTPECPIDAGDWEYDNNETLSVNNTLVSILSSRTYYPDDVFMDDLMNNDDSFFEAILIAMDIDLGALPLVGDILANLEEYDTAGNITLYDYSNKTDVLADDYNGMSNTTVNADFLVNNYEDVGGVGMNASIQLLSNNSLNCYHVVDESLFMIHIIASWVNMTNSSQTMVIDVSLSFDYTLICSTLPACPVTTFNWIWILVLVLGLGLIALISLMMVRQRKQCDETVNMVKRGNTRELNTDEFRSLPNVCKIDKYKPISK